jgi:PST family polysaccharide transporter
MTKSVILDNSQHNQSAPTNELRQKTATGVFWSGAQVWGGRMISFVIFVVLSRHLSPKEFGLVAYALVFIAFVQVFLEQGFGDAIVQHADLQREHLDTAFWTNLLTGILLTLLSISLASLIASLFRESGLTIIIRWLSLTFILAGLSSTQQAILQRQLAFKPLAIRSLIATSAGGVVGIVLALLGFGVWSLVAQNLISGFVGVVILWKVSLWRPRFHLSKLHFFELFRFGINMVGIKVLTFLNRNSDNFLIGYFLGPTILGFYTIAYKLLIVITDLLTGVSTSVAFPTFSRLQNDPERMRRAFYKATHYTSLISFPVFIGVAVLAPELVVALFGPQWLPSILVLRVLSFIGILQSVFFFNYSVVIAAGKPSWRLRITLMNAVSNVIAFAVVVRWGIVAVAAAYVVRGYLLSPIEIWVLKKVIDLDIKYYLKQYIAPLAGSVAMVLALAGLKIIVSDSLNQYIRLIIYILSGGGIYLLVVQFVEPSIWQQMLELLRLATPKWIWKKA